MAEKVGSIYFDLDLDDSKFNSGLDSANTKTRSFSDKLKESSLTLAALGAAATVALTQVTGMLNTAVDAAVKQQNALMGLSSIAKGTGNDIQATTQAAKDLAADGLMPIGDAASGLKNLLGAGLSLPQAIKLMNAFKDSAAFGRQGSLEFGQAIVGATEGIKNGNSALVDNAGVTKNLSNILVEAGYSAMDLSKAGSDAGVRMALFNGIIAETKNQTGDAARLADSFGGAQARMTTQITAANVALGEAMQPILGKIMAVLSPLISMFVDFVSSNKELAAAIAVIAVTALSLLAVLGIVGAVVGAVMTLGTVGVVAAAVAAGVAGVAGALVFLETKFGAVSTAARVIGDWLGRLRDIVVGLFDLFIRGDITGGFLRAINQQEDSPLIDTLWRIREALSAVYEFVSEQFMSIWDSLKSIFGQVATAVQPLVDALGSVFGAIGGFLSKHADAILNVFKWIGIVIGGILIAPLAIAFGLLVGALKVVAVVLKWVADNFDMIKRVVLTILAVVFAPLIAAVVAVIAIFKAIVWTVQTLWTVVSFVFNAIWAVVSFVFGMIAAVWNSVLAPVFNAIIFILTSLFNVWWSIFTGILSVVTTIISTIAQIIFVVLQGVWNFIYGTILQPIGNLFASIFTAIFNVVSWAVNAVWGVISSVFGAIFGFIGGILSSIFNTVSSIFNSIWNTISRIVSGVWGTVTGTFGRIADAVWGAIKGAYDKVTGWVGSFLNAGKDLITGLVNGISNAKDAVVNKVKDICAGALDSVKKFFGIKSPSRVMATMGDYLMEGFSNGIERAGGAAVSAAETIAERVSDGVSASIDNVSNGTRSITGLYSGMYRNLNAMGAAGAIPLGATSTAIANAAEANAANGGAIAAAPINISVNPQGVIARSRSEFRDIIADGISAVNEDLVSRGLPQIGGGKVAGSSSV